MSFCTHNSFGPSFGHSFSRPLSFDIPSRCGPRHCGQSVAPTFIVAEDCVEPLVERNAIKKVDAINMNLRASAFIFFSSGITAVGRVEEYIMKEDYEIDENNETNENKMPDS